MSADRELLEARIDHLTALREADHDFAAERDRRYSEVKQAEEKALKIKEEADSRALVLAEKIQEYKDAKANELREQINSERNLYATKEEMAAALKPLVAQSATFHGRSEGVNALWGYIVGAAGLLTAIAAVVLTAH